MRFSRSLHLMQTKDHLVSCCAVQCEREPKATINKEPLADNTLLHIDILGCLLFPVNGFSQRWLLIGSLGRYNETTPPPPVSRIKRNLARDMVLDSRI